MVYTPRPCKFRVSEECNMYPRFLRNSEQMPPPVSFDEEGERRADRRLEFLIPDAQQVIEVPGDEGE